jgi:hypothetical protein
MAGFLDPDRDRQMDRGFDPALEVTQCRFHIFYLSEQSETLTKVHDQGEEHRPPPFPPPGRNAFHSVRSTYRLGFGAATFVNYSMPM